MTQENRRVAAVVGVGPGLGAALARRFARGGFEVGLMARGLHNLAPVAERLEQDRRPAHILPTDAADPESVAESFAALRSRAGDPEVLIYNAGAFQMAPLAETTVEDVESAWRTNCLGAFLALKEVLPAMEARGRGTVLLTGATASLRGGSGFSAFAIGKFGLRALAQSAARELMPRGIHVAHVVVDGQIATPRMRGRHPERPLETLLDPDAIAESFWQLHAQPRSAWTFELDLRPHVERF